MIEQKKLKKKRKNGKQKRLIEAKKTFEEMQGQIAPFIKSQKIGKGYSTIGKWCESLVLCEK
jgi:hypothetical protein